MPRIAAFACFLSLAVAVGTAHAQDAYPSRPVTVIVPFTPGGATDIVVRMMGRILAEELGQPFVIENRPGGGGLIGVEQAARARPDGYTLLGTSTGSVTISPLLYRDRKFDSLARLEPVGIVASTPQVLMVRDGLPAKSVDDLVALSKSLPPGKLNLVSPGVGTLQHFTNELFQLKNGVRWTHIPLTGSVPALNELIAGRADILLDMVPSSAPFIESGRVRALAVTTPERSGRLPEVPTLGELGYAGYHYSGWQAFLAPKGTPPEIVRKLNAIIDQALRRPDVREQLAKFGLDPVGGAPAVLGKQMSDEIRQWSELIKVAGITAEN